MRRHPDTTVLHRLLDEPAGVSVADREHVRTCPQCLDGLAAPRPGGDAVPATVPTVRARAGAALRRPVVAALTAAVVVGGAGAAAAGGWLEIFRTEGVAPVRFDASELVSLPDLEALGDVEVTGADAVRTVADAAAASAETGLDVPTVTALPRGVGGEPVHHVGGEVTATFTFSADQAAELAAASGAPLPPPPPGLDGGQVQLVVGPGSAQVWSSDVGAPALVVARVVAPSVHSPDVRFETARDYLLSLPGVPGDLAAQLRTFTADGATLPLPVPSDRVSTASAEVDGVPATVLVSHDRTVAAVVWVDDGVVTAVAGALDADEVLSVARDLR